MPFSFRMLPALVESESLLIRIIHNLQNPIHLLFHLPHPRVFEEKFHIFVLFLQKYFHRFEEQFGIVVIFNKADGSFEKENSRSNS